MNLRLRLEIEPTVLFKIYIFYLLIWLCWVLAEACWIFFFFLVAALELLVLAHKM